MPSANALAADLTRKQQEHGVWLAQFKSADGGYNMTSDQVAEFRTRNNELNELGERLAEAREIEKSAADVAEKTAPQGRVVKAEVKDDDEPETKGGVEVAIKAALEKRAAQIKNYQPGDAPIRFDLKAGLKTLLQTTAAAPQADRRGSFESALYFGNVEDLFPHGTTDSKSIDYMIQTTDTDNAAAVAQGSAVTDSAFAWTATTDPIEVVQTWIPLTREALGDIPFIQSTVTGMLAKRLQKLSNNLILAGDGSTPNPTGVSVRTGVQSQAKGTDPTLDAIHKAITLVNVTGDADANAIFLHPTDWQEIALERTGDGIYILGNPQSVTERRLWGLPVHLTTGIGAAGTGLVGDTSYAQVVEREGVSLEISTEHSTYFTERKVALMMFRRFAVAGYRPSAFCKVTGI